jgi:hypothetical protein
MFPHWKSVSSRTSCSPNEKPFPSSSSIEFTQTSRTGNALHGTISASYVFILHSVGEELEELSRFFSPEFHNPGNALSQMSQPNQRGKINKETRLPLPSDKKTYLPI